MNPLEHEPGQLMLHGLPNHTILSLVESDGRLHGLLRDPKGKVVPFERMLDGTGVSSSHPAIVLRPRQKTVYMNVRDAGNGLVISQASFNTPREAHNAADESVVGRVIVVLQEGHYAT